VIIFECCRHRTWFSRLCVTAVSCRRPRCRWLKLRSHLIECRTAPSFSPQYVAVCRKTEKPFVVHVVRLAHDARNNVTTI